MVRNLELCGLTFDMSGGLTAQPGDVLSMEYEGTSHLRANGVDAPRLVV
jgi:hypothetical protein